MHGKNSKHETSQNKRQEKLKQDSTRSNPQSRSDERSVKSTSRKIAVQEVAQIEEAAPTTTCRKAKHMNMINVFVKNN